MDIFYACYRCKFFLYTKNRFICELYSSMNRTCRSFRGPPVTKLQGCPFTTSTMSTISTISTTTITPTTTITSTTEGVCRDITLDECDLKHKPFKTSSSTGSAKNCQNYCKSIYGPFRCQFFIYDQKREICQLFHFPMSEYHSRCNIKGGPPEPDLEKCERIWTTGEDSSKNCSVSFISTFSK